MCSLCGALGKGPSWEQGGDSDSPRWQMHRHAVETAARLNQLLSASRIRTAAHPDHGFVVSFPTGGMEIVKSLDDIWHLLSRRKIPVPDPLAGS